MKATSLTYEDLLEAFRRQDEDATKVAPSPTTNAAEDAPVPSVDADDNESDRA